MDPPLPPVEQEAPNSQQDQDDARHQQVEDKLVGVRVYPLLVLMACVSQRNGVKMGHRPGCPLTCWSSFQLCGAPSIPGTSLALKLPEGQHNAPRVASGKQ